MWSDDLCGIGRKRTLGSQGDNADNTHGCGAEPEHVHARNVAAVPRLSDFAVIGLTN